MGIVRESFVMFKNWADAIDCLPVKYQLECFKAVTKYGLTGLIPDNLSPVVKALILSFSVGMENNIARYRASVANGRLGGRPPKNQEKTKETQPEKDVKKITQENLDKPSRTQENLEEPNHNLNDNDNVNVNVNIEREKREKFFQSLSQNFKKLSINVNEENFNVNKFDIDKLFSAIRESSFLQGSSLLFIINNYDKVISGYYKTFKVEKETHFAMREKGIDNVYDNLDDDIEI